MTELALRPRSPTEIIDLAVRLLRRHFGALFTIALLSLLPGLVVQLVTLVANGGDPVRTAGTRVTYSTPVSFIMSSLMVAAMTVYADDVLRGGAADVRSAFGRAGARLPVVLGVTFLSTLATIVGFVLLVVPGVYVALRLATSVPAAVLEGTGVVESLRRAWARGEGHLGHTFVTFLLLFVIYFVFLIAFGIVAALVGAGAAGLGAITGGRGGLLLGVAAQVVTTIVTAALYPLISNVALLLTYDLRVRNEGYDVEAMVASLGTAG